MNRRDWLRMVSALTLMEGVKMMGEGQKRRLPNLLFCLTDDQAQWAVGAYGNTDIYTPNMDRLAREGMRFNYAVTCPVCSPSRAMILTGRYPHQVGIDDWIHPQETEGIDPNVTLLSEVLKQAGYVTGLIGKWHLGKEPQYHPLKRGFDYFMGFTGGGNQPKDPTLEINGKEQQVKGFLIDFMTEDALKFIRQHYEHPFALFFHTREPHSPYTPVPEQDAAHYAGKRLKVPSVPSVPEERLQQVHRDYYASVSSIDRNLGRLLDELESLGIADNTIVVFMGDNGYMIGQHGLYSKGNAAKMTADRLFDPKQCRPNMFDLSIMVPLIFRWPGVVPANSVCDKLVNSIDLFPTFVDILRQAGCVVPDGMQFEGQSLLPLLRGEKVAWRDAVFLIYDMHHYTQAHMRMVRTSRWKLVLHFEEGGQHELYDLQNDPDEERNLYGDPSVKAVQDDLTERLQRWQKQVGDPLAK